MSLTSTWCKVMNTIVRDNFMEHIKEFNMLTENQHDFRQKRSCCTQLLKTVHDWAKAEDISSPVDAIYLDYRKAFDSVSHERLLEKLKVLGINCSIRTWIRSFLTDRWQKISVNGSYSDAIKITSGVPQGSNLGSVLFLLYINDMPAEVGNKLQRFADDYKLYAEVLSEGDAQKLQADLNAITDWAVDF